MEYNHEIINYKDHLPLKLFIHKVGHISRHWHQSIEILFVLAGGVQIIVEDKSYLLSEEDIILINSNNIHEIHSYNCIMLALQVDLSQFDTELIDDNKVLFECNSTEGANKNKFRIIKSLMAQLIKLSLDYNDHTDGGISPHGLQSKAITYRLLNELVVNFKSTKNLTNRIQTQKHLDRMSQLLSYIDNHYNESISLTKLAELAHFSPAYLSRFFEKHMSINFSSYIQGVRLSHAVNDLLSTDLSIEEISIKTGFPNPRALVAAFKNAYEVLPSIYRKQSQKRSVSLNEKKLDSVNYLEIKQSDYLSKLLAYLPENAVEENMFAVDPVQSCVLTIDTSAPGIPLRHTFKNFISVGRAKDILYADIQEMLKSAQREIGFKYVKFHGLLNDDMMFYSENEDGQPDLSYTYIDKVVDFLLSIGLRPFVQFSFMPGLLAAEPDRTIGYNPHIISPPKDMKKWTYLINELTRHFVLRYGMREVSQWLFTVWNEPDSSPNLFGFDRDGVFFELYKYTFQSVKAVSKALQFGGPSFMNLRIKQNECWFSSFISFCKENDCMPDYINYHYYPITKNSSQSGLSPFLNTKINFSENPDYFRFSLKKLKKQLKELGVHDKVLYLTEWNSTTLHSDLLNDTCFKSAYIVKNILENYDEIESFGYWVLSDMIEECRIKNDLFYGGLGMFTFNCIKKPAYYAYYLLNKLGNTLLTAGEGYFATRNDENIQLMLYNYQHYNSLYAVGEVMLQTQTQRYSPFPDRRKLVLDINLRSLEKGSYIMTQYIVNRKYGSCFDKWVEMGAQPLVHGDEVDLLRALSNPMQKKTVVNIENDQFNASFELEPHEIRFVELRKVD